MDKIEIIKENGKWLVNEKPYAELSYTEKLFFDEFLIAIRLEEGMKEYENNLKSE
jgi:hypothetical protein